MYIVLGLQKVLQSGEAFLNRNCLSNWEITICFTVNPVESSENDVSSSSSSCSLPVSTIFSYFHLQTFPQTTLVCFPHYKHWLFLWTLLAQWSKTDRVSELSGRNWILWRHCPHTVFMCFVWISEQTAIISLYSIYWLVFITEIKPFTAQWSLYVPTV
jgi:hypothetical protein